MTKIKTLACLCATLATAACYAVPARRGLITVTQPDGTTINIQRVGDEHLHYTLDAQGHVLATDARGLYTYATVDAQGCALPTGRNALLAPDGQAVKIHDLNTPGIYNAKARAKAATTGTATAAKTHAPVAVPQRLADQKNPYYMLGRFDTRYPAKGSPRALIILVQYTDVKFTVSQPASYYQQMINGQTFTQYGGTGSVINYFTQVSKGQFTPQFDVLGPVTLPNNRAYYGANDRWDEDQRPEDMVVHAISALDATTDFSVYDNDGDGYLDNVFIIYAGQGEASYGDEDTVWPHAWELSSAGKAFKADGVTVDSYGCTNEWEQNRPDGIGTFCHEYSHVIGLPDLYSTDYGASETLTPHSWSVLDYGPYNNNGNTPPSYGAYERNAMGWGDFLILDSPASVSLENLHDSNTAALIPTASATEFFLVENRQQTAWDKYLPNHGMLLWHIDYNKSVFNANTVNNTASHMYVDLIEAGKTANSKSDATLASYSFPGTSGARAVTSAQYTAYKTWTGTTMPDITLITETTQGTVTFDFDGGQSPLETPVPEPQPEINSDHFVARWQSVDGATDYLLTVHAVIPGTAMTQLANMGSGTKFSLPTGWTSSTTNTYTTTGNYGDASPSHQMKTNGAWLQTAQFPGPITKVQFWAKGQNASGSTLAVQGYDGEAWSQIEVITPQNTAQTYTVANIPPGTVALKFVYTKSAGNLAIDDIAVTYGGETATVHLDFDEKPTGGQTSAQVPLAQGVSQYRYNVVATDGQYRSRPSAFTEVNVTAQGITLPDGTLPDGPQAPAEYFTLQGLRVNPAALTPGIYLMRRGNTTTKIHIK